MAYKRVEEEMAELSTGDKRLDNRTRNILRVIGNKPSLPFAQQFQSGAELKACYRLFDSDLISEKVILEPHFNKTVDRIKLCDVKGAGSCDSYDSEKVKEVKICSPLQGLSDLCSLLVIPYHRIIANFL